MFPELIKLIQAVEAENGEIKQLVEQKANTAITEAKRTGKAAVEEAIARAEAEISHLRHVSDKKAMEDAMELASSTANRLAALRARAERRLDAAARTIYERIVSV